MTAERPVPELFAGVVSQDAAVAALRAAAANPVHAYLFRGPPGNGGLAAAYGFAAALLCPEGGCGECATCRAALAGTDPDLHIVRRSGASVSKETLRQVVALAQRRPLHAARQVIVILDVHLVLDRAPALLKTLEEPPGDTVFVLLADDVTPDLVTIASRCVEVAFPPVPRAELVQWLDGLGRAGRHGGGGGGQQRRQPRTGPRHGRRSRRGGPRRAVGVGARGADRGGDDRGRDDPPRAGIGRPGRRAAARRPRP